MYAILSSSQGKCVWCRLGWDRVQSYMDLVAVSGLSAIRRKLSAYFFLCPLSLRDDAGVSPWSVRWLRSGVNRAKPKLTSLTQCSKFATRDFSKAHDNSRQHHPPILTTASQGMFLCQFDVAAQLLTNILKSPQPK